MSPPEGQGQEAEPHEGLTASQPAEPPTTPTIELDGETVTLDQVRQWKKGHMMEGDYRRKTSSVAEERRVVQEDRLALQREQEQWLAQRDAQRSNGNVASSQEGTMAGNPAFQDPLEPKLNSIEQRLEQLQRDQELRRIEQAVRQHTPWLKDEPEDWRDDHLRNIYGALSWKMTQEKRALSDDEIGQVAAVYHERVAMRDKHREDRRLAELGASKQQAASKAPGGAGRGGGGPAIPTERPYERLKLGKGMDARSEMQRVASEAGRKAIGMIREASEE